MLASSPRPAPLTRTGFIWAELTVGFAVLPVVIGWLVPPAAWIVVLWVIAAGAELRVRQQRTTPSPGNLVVEPRSPWVSPVRTLLLRFLALSGLLTLLLLLLAPQRIFTFPGTNPRQWLLLCVLYPIISVYPQEVLYRRYLMQRLGNLTSSRVHTVALSAISFAWMHLVFQNVVALLLTLTGGWLFADTYSRTRSLRLVWLEHSLYGVFVLTIGLGDFLWHGRDLG